MTSISTKMTKITLVNYFTLSLSLPLPAPAPATPPPAVVAAEPPPPPHHLRRPRPRLRLLPRYGLHVDLTNYAASYYTGLLLTRRTLKKLEIDEEYEGNLEATGEDFSVEPGENHRPFRRARRGLLRRAR